MRVNILLFAFLKDVAGTNRLEVEVAEGGLVQDALAQVAAAHPALERWLPHVRVAVNMDYAGQDQVLRAGDEVALIPPVSGGQELYSVREAALSLDEVVQAVQTQMGGAAGAICTFLGVVRENALDPEGRRHQDIQYLDYEAYAPMAEKQMASIGAVIREHFGAACAMTHRVGRLGVGEASVAIAVASAHRKEALDACRYAIEELKKRVPVWKKETAASGHWWVEGSAG